MNVECELHCEVHGHKFTIERVKADRDGVFLNKTHPRPFGGKTAKECPECGGPLIRKNA